MSSAIPSPIARQDTVSLSPGPPAAGTLTVTATYWLSEDGRKAALLAGADARAKQIIHLVVPAARLHLVSVDDNGVARLKLRPRFERDSTERIVRLDASPRYDAPPTVEQLFVHATRNFELEREFSATREAAQSERVDAERELRLEAARAFLTDPGQRAMVHPAPTSTRCYVMTAKGRRLFDAATDTGPAAQLPAEAHRRFRADLRARTEHRRQTRAAQLALHEQKKAAVAAWIAAHGSDDQRVRQSAGVLPLPEAIEAMTTHVFAPAGEARRYVRDGAARLERHLRETSSSYADATVIQADLLVTSTEASGATEAQWEAIQHFRTSLPMATVRLLRHRLSWRRDVRAPTLTVFSITVTQKQDLITLRREYAAPDAS